MFVFISWSGPKSRKVATALHEWLPCVIHSVEPFMSSEDIYAGTRWQSEIAGQLAKSDAGIVCITRTNRHSPWLNFEAGALAKIVEHSRVIPLAIGLRPVEIEQPLGQFQAQNLDQPGIRSLVTSINQAAEAGLKAAILEKSFAKWWPDLATRLAAIEDEPDADGSAKAPPTAPTQRSAEDMMAEVLAAVRSLDAPSVTTDRFSRVDDVMRIVDREMDTDAVSLISSHRIRFVGIVAWLCRNYLNMSISEIAGYTSESPKLLQQRIADIDSAIKTDPDVADLMRRLVIRIRNSEL